jgi:glucose-1-phosphate cytidylyltransferase
MKVVLFCGGLGMRLREYSDTIPKPMVHIGYRPILWHVMKYYAHFGHKDFVLCLGYKADAVKDYFRRYDETLSNDFVLTGGGRNIELLNSDIDDWRITFVDTGIDATIGERLKAVEHHLDGEEIFLANYCDGLSDLDLNAYIETVLARDVTASFLAVRPTQTFHVVTMHDGGVVRSIEPLEDSGIWINAGYFVFRRAIFDRIHHGEDLVFEPFQRLIDEGQLYGHRYDGFWTAMDTFKDKERLDVMYTRGHAPWELWRGDRAAGRPGTNGSRAGAPVPAADLLKAARP